MPSWCTTLLLLAAASSTVASATPVTASANPVTASANPVTASATPVTASTPVAEHVSVPPTTPPLHHKAEVVVIDSTKNTTSVVAIPLEPGNMTAAEILLNKEAHKLHCLTEQKANIFLLIHLNRNWRQKLNFVRRLLGYTYEQASTNVVILFFNAFINIYATFGPGSLTTEAELLAALSQVQAKMEKDENAALSGHWVHFQMDDALNAGLRYAKLFLHPLSLDARPSVLLSYFDDGADINDATIDDAEKVMRQPDSPFKASVSLLQWPANLPVPPLWTRVSEMLSSTPGFQLTGPTEAGLLGLLAGLAGDLCNRTRAG